METNYIMMIFQVVVLVFSAIIHEYMHGWAADQMGDSTARDEGRLTLNPLPHIDPVGSILFPLLMLASGIGFVFGWAKPVPYNPYNLRDKIYGGAKVALAGPLGNLITALFFGMILRFGPFVSLQFSQVLQIIVYINILLMVFNLVPIPPMDGSKVLMPFLPYSLQTKYAALERYGMFFILLFMFFGFSLIQPFVFTIFRLIVGV